MPSDTRPSSFPERFKSINEVELVEVPVMLALQLPERWLVRVSTGNSLGRAPLEPVLNMKSAENWPHPWRFLACSRTSYLVFGSRAKKT